MPFKEFKRTRCDFNGDEGDEIEAVYQRRQEIDRELLDADMKLAGLVHSFELDQEIPEPVKKTLDDEMTHEFGDWTCFMELHSYPKRPTYIFYFAEEKDWIMAKFLLS